jgi:protein involved in polysaccharide export with SLBB domain
MRIRLSCLAVISVLTAFAQDQPVAPGNGIIVRGCVIKPGVYPFLLHDTVKTAIGESRGLMKGWLAIAYIYRTDNEGISHEIEVLLGEIMRRKSPDIELQPGDILYVPFSSGTSPKNRPEIIDPPISPPGSGRS